MNIDSGYASFEGENEDMTDELNIPVHESHIVSTFQSLPKTPKDGGLIEVKL